MSVEPSASASPSIAYVGSWVALGLLSSLYIGAALGLGPPDETAVSAAGNLPPLRPAITAPPQLPATVAVVEPAPEVQPAPIEPPPPPAAVPSAVLPVPPPAAAPPVVQPIETGSLPQAAPSSVPQVPPKRLPKVINLTPEPRSRTAERAPLAADTAPLVAAPSPPSSTVAIATSKTTPAPPEKSGNGPFALLLGTEGSLDEARANWAISSAQSPALERFEPRVTTTDAFGSRSYRLAAGPVPTRAEAVKICAELRAAGVTCRVGGFAGEPIPAR